jgi:allantoinase
MTLPRERLSYSSPFTRPPLRLPGKARMIVWSVVNIEEWEITRPMARQLSQPPMGQTPIPDMPNWTWYEYGMRVGFWRLLRALAQAGVTPTMSINAKVCETYPEVAAAARDAGWEFMAHAYVQMPIQQIEDQRAVIRQSVELIEKFTGKRPTGWLGPGRGQTFDTLDYVTECGLTWFGDWILDDQPLWVKTAHGPILSVPYSAEINDITLMISHHHERSTLSTGFMQSPRNQRACWQSACIRTSPAPHIASNISSSSTSTSTSTMSCTGPDSRSTTGTPSSYRRVAAEARSANQGRGLGSCVIAQQLWHPNGCRQQTSPSP